MNVQTNSAISVDCVIFGFDGAALKALLVRRKTVDPLYDEKELKLPGAMILENETLEEAPAVYGPDRRCSSPADCPRTPQGSA